MCILIFISCRVFTQDTIQQQLLKAKSEPLFEDTNLVAAANSLNGAKSVIHPGSVSHQLGPLLNDHLNAKVYLSAHNLFTISYYKKPDPEVQGGLDQAEYPRPRTLMMALIVQFQ